MLGLWGRRCLRAPRLVGLRAHLALALPLVTLDALTALIYDLTPHLGLLQTSGNVLAVQALNSSAGSPDLLASVELSAVDGNALAGGNFVYFLTPTPGATNGAAVSNAGPIISAVTDAGTSCRVCRVFSAVTSTRCEPPASVAAEPLSAGAGAVCCACADQVASNEMASTTGE